MENRFLENKVELREGENGEEFIEGYGIVFNRESHVMTTQKGTQFREIVSPEAFKNTDMSDVIGRGNHTNALLLGRTSSGTMSLKVDETGVYYRIKVPNTSAGRDMKEYIKRGDIVGSSFAFPKPVDEVRKGEDGILVRTLTDVSKLVDIGPVISPAYPDATTGYNARSVDEFKEEVKEEAKEEAPKETPQEEEKETPKVIGLSISEKIELEKLRG